MNVSVGAIAGQVLLWLGFLGGAFVTVLRLDNREAPWQTIDWRLYGLFAVIGIAGVILLRINKAAQRAQSASSAEGLDKVTQYLAQAAERVAHLVADLQNMSCEQVLEYIDGDCGPVLADFADGRMVISDRLGTAVFAEVMTEFASGERYLNRAWSAAADGYVDEVESSIGHANQFLAAAVQKLNEAAQA
jgi:hypothetical protein